MRGGKLDLPLVYEIFLLFAELDDLTLATGRACRRMGVVVVAVLAVDVLLGLVEGGGRRLDLLGGGLADLAHDDGVVERLARERVVRVDHDRVGLDLDDAHHDLVAIRRLAESLALRRGERLSTGHLLAAIATGVAKFTCML